MSRNGVHFVSAPNVLSNVTAASSECSCEAIAPRDDMIQNFIQIS